MNFNAAYWQERYDEGKTGWDIGYPAPALVAHFDTLLNKDIDIAIPGAGNAYEAQYLHEQGFANVHVIDLAQAPLQRLKKQCPSFPEAHLHHQDFFEHIGQYDLIVEQTFFCALHPSWRSAYAKQMAELLKKEGELFGLLFDDSLFEDHPPFGGNEKIYRQVLEPHLDIVRMERTIKSIPERSGRELIFAARRNNNGV